MKGLNNAAIDCITTLFEREHLEGSIGLLHVTPKFRRKGYAMALQKKLGLTQSENTISWMWR
ncbi:hypothetical protein SAMN02910358_01412 [Lachnospiraceae bacterium XBB1006]|nr:hypothetical protein SAMN02910358_01412 [Lachnospiraceae bacterium XBB1006]